MISVIPILRVSDLVVGYEKKPVLKGISLSVDSGEVVAIVGHNGSGKSTLLRSVFGLLPPWAGNVEITGVSKLQGDQTHLIRQGVAYVPQGNRVFSELTVCENLQVAAEILKATAPEDRLLQSAFEMFPALKERSSQRAGALSGGEKQMLALGIALVSQPRLLLLDEPSLGLGPNLVRQALTTVRAVASGTRTAILIVEQKVREVLKIADRVYVFRNGQVSYSGSPAELQDLSGHFKTGQLWSPQNRPVEQHSERS